MELIALGLLLLGAAVVLSVVAQTNRRLARQALGTGVSSIGEVLALCATVSDQVGPGLFSQQVGIQGTLECDQPLQSDLSHLPCAAFRSRVERRWEEEYEERDEHGGRTRRTRGGSDQVASNERRVPFWVRDVTGRLLVLPYGATVEMEQTVDRFEPSGGDSVLPWPVRPGVRRGTRRTLGYRYREEILPPGRAVYVLGMASDRTGSLVVGGLPEASTPFLVSLQTREQVLQSARRTEALARAAACVCAPLGVLLLILGLLLGRWPLH